MRELMREPSRAEQKHSGICCIAAAVIGGVATLGGAAIASSGASKGAKAQAGAAADANATQRYMYDTSRADQQPWLDAGKNALGRLNAASTPGGDLSFLTSQPGYQFGLNQGVGAITQSKAANGLLNSGSTLKALNTFGQDYAGTKLGEYWNREAGLAGVGQTAANQLGAAGQNYANQYGQNVTNAGNARASAYANNGQTWGNALGSLGGAGINAYQQRQNSAWGNPAAYAQPNGIPVEFNGVI